MSPKQRIDLELSSKNVMSVDIPQFSSSTRTSNESDIFPYGFAFTSFELDDAVMSLNELLPDLIRLAEIEKSCVMIPRYQETIKYISMKLEENDRSSRTRLMKVKDMLLDKAHHYSEHYN